MAEILTLFPNEAEDILMDLAQCIADLKAQKVENIIKAELVHDCGDTHNGLVIMYLLSMELCKLIGKTVYTEKSH